MSETKAAKQIYEYLKRVSKPESLQALINALGNYKKTDVEHALKHLIEENKVIERMNGKLKIYYLNQKELRKNTKENIDDLNKRIMSESESLKLIENEIKKKEFELSAFDGKQTKAELTIEHSKLSKRLEEVKSQLESLISKNMKKKEQKYDLEYVSKECRKRKRITKEIIDCIEEFVSKPKKKLLEEIGIEFYE